MLFKDISCLEVWQPLWLVEQNNLCNFGRGHHKKHFCEVISNLDHWFRRCCLKDFLSEALAALVFSGAKPFRGHYGKHSCEVIFKFGPVVQEMSFKETVYGRRTKTDHNSSP